ncbi:MAG: lysophospholipid acyltransferase family protein [Alphaproteobacteria bacterium]|nr:lysophospholipid acyltransferase family protein [Alphaproteobacteria bacterium]
MNLYKKYIKKPLKKLGSSRFVINLISAVFYYYTKLVGKTTRWHIEGVEEFHQIAKENNGIILVIWHGRAAMLPFFKQKSLPLDALVSVHRDGQMIAGLLKRYGIGIIGASSNENAISGALQLMRTLKEDTSICIIPDGPRGPRMVMTKSPIYYAWKTGKPLIGASYSISNSILVTKAWDHTMIPFPFSNGVCKTTKPLYVPKDTPESELEKYRIEMENRLNQIAFECDREMNLTPVRPDPNATNIKRRTSTTRK